MIIYQCFFNLRDCAFNLAHRIPLKWKELSCQNLSLRTNTKIFKAFFSKQNNISKAARGNKQILCVLFSKYASFSKVFFQCVVFISCQFCLSKKNLLSITWVKLPCHWKLVFGILINKFTTAMFNGGLLEFFTLFRITLFGKLTNKSSLVTLVKEFLNYNSSMMLSHSACKPTRKTLFRCD